ncbi:MAG TPA: RNA 2',3'-cyclic phosphodiesterase [Actinomycetota bacterium]|nr:RNA 2',3'-cyclic phosphodiesterase [Actinomycetota bacterium]
MTEGKALRLFVCVDLSDEAAEILGRVLVPWQERLPRARWVARRKWHVTVRFLGRTQPDLLDFVEEACRGAAAEVEPFEVSLAGLGVFPGRTRARVLWAGVDDPRGALATLAAGLDRRLAPEFEPETRPFTPHMTVARFNPPEPFREHADALDRTELETAPWEIDRLLLYRSQLSPKGSEYELLQSFPVG